MANHVSLLLLQQQLFFSPTAALATKTEPLPKSRNMASASLTERLAAEAIALTREAYRPTVCCWFPACSIGKTSWRCGCAAKVGARSEEQAAEQQQRALVRGLVRGVGLVEQQNFAPGAAQETTNYMY